MSRGQPLLVGVDVGTTRVKAGLIGLDGRELTRAAVPTVWQRTPTGAEARPDDFVKAVHDVLAAMLATAPLGEVLAVGITSMAETAVLVAPGGEAVGPAVAWYDRRAESEVQRMELALTREEIDRRTGLGIGPIPTVAMLRWLTAANPSLRRAVSVLSVAEWVVHRLGGSVAAEPSLASRTGALAISGRRWWPEVIEWAGLPESMFPELRSAGSSWGNVRGARGALNRLDGAALTVGGHDHLVAAIGSGVTSAGQVMDSCGTAEALVRAIPADTDRDPAAGIPHGIATGWHALAGHYCLLAGLPLGIDLTPLLARLGAAHRGGRASLDDAALASLDGRLADADVPRAALRVAVRAPQHRLESVGVAARARAAGRAGRRAPGQRGLGREPGPPPPQERRVPEHGVPTGVRGRRTRRRPAGRRRRRRVCLGRRLSDPRPGRRA